MTVTPARRRPGAVLQLLPALVVAASAGAAPVHADGEQGPPLPPQPGIASPVCGSTGAAPAGWSLAARETARDRIPSYTLRVDPTSPCDAYRADDAQTVARSTDGGRTWRQVFHDDRPGTPSRVGAGDPTCVLVCAASTPARPFQASQLATPGAGVVVLGERGNGDAVVRSVDGGAHWNLAGAGIAGQPVQRLTFAPGDPRTAYAVVMSDSATTGDTAGTTFPSFALEVTADSGDSWQAAAVPSTVPHTDVGIGDGLPRIGVLTPLVQVDAHDPGHLWLMLRTEGAATLLESHDRGTTWAMAGALPNVTVTQFLVVQSPHHSLRMLVLGTSAASTTTTSLMVSDDGGQSWRQGPPAASSNGGRSVMASSPTDPDSVMLVMTGTRAQSDSSTYHGLVPLYSRDAFDTLLLALPPTVSGAVGAGGPMTPSDGADLDPDAVIQADRSGAFYLGVDVDCTPLHNQVGTLTLAPGCPVAGLDRREYWRYLPPARATSGELRPVGGSASSAGTLPATPLVEAAHCALPGSKGTGNDNGSLGYDGHDLLYTEYGETGPRPDEGVIHRIDPTTCTPDSDIVVQFSRADLQRLYDGDAYSLGDRTVIDGIAYDFRRDVIWASLATGWPAAGGSWPFAVRVVDAAANPARAVARLAFDTGCGAFLSYDSSDDSLWTCDHTATGSHVAAADGHNLGDCGTTLANDPRITSGAATWGVNAPGRILVQGEDDATLYEYDSVVCAPVAQYQHRVFSEPNAEDEQLVCDPTTLAPDQPGLLHGTLVWLRDSATQLAVGYLVPDALCPLPTVTRYVGPTSSAPGAPLTLCATLHVRGHETPLARMRLDFTLGSTALGGAATDGGGRACIDTRAPLRAGSVPLAVTYAGDAQYLPSSDAATLTVVVAVPLQAPRPAPPAFPQRALPLPPLPSGGHPAPYPQSQPDTAAQSEIQAQAQAQSQVQSQSVTQLQPGLMPQRQRQTQVATQTASIRNAQAAWSAVRSRVHGDARTWALAGIVAAAALGRLPRRRLVVVRARRGG